MEPFSQITHIQFGATRHPQLELAVEATEEDALELVTRYAQAAGALRRWRG